MEQRVRLANLVAFYRANRPWMDELAFSTRPQKWSDYNAFVSANIGSNRVALTKTEAANGTCIVAPYRISEGNIAPIVHNRVASGHYATNLYVGDVNPTTATVAEVTAALLANNNGMFEGQQLSLIVNYQQQAGGVYRAVVRYYECILSLTDKRPFAEVLSDTHIAAVNQSIGFTAGANDPVMGFSFILSFDEGGKTRVSTQSLVLTDTSTYDAYLTTSALNAAIESYGGGQVNAFLAAGYHNASQGGVTIPLSILNVNGVQAGALLGSGQENDTRLIVTFNESVEGTATSYVVLNTGGINQRYEDGTQSPSISSSIVDGKVVIDTNNLGSLNANNDIVEVGCTIDGTTYTIAFDTNDIDG